jgi:hypothetical protein
MKVGYLTLCPAPPDNLAKIYNRFLVPTMVAKATAGQMSLKETIKWAARKLEGIV